MDRPGSAHVTMGCRLASPIVAPSSSTSEFGPVSLSVVWSPTRRPRPPRPAPPHGSRRENPSSLWHSRFAPPGPLPRAPRTQQERLRCWCGSPEEIINFPSDLNLKRDADDGVNARDCWKEDEEWEDAYCRNNQSGKLTRHIYADEGDEDDYNVIRESQVSKVPMRSLEERSERRSSDGYKGRDGDSSRGRREDDNDWDSSRRSSSRIPGHDVSHNKSSQAGPLIGSVLVELIQLTVGPLVIRQGPAGKAPSRGEQNDNSQNFVDTELFGTKFDVILVECRFSMGGICSSHSWYHTDHIEYYWTPEDIMNLKIEKAIADTPSFIFLWVGDGAGLEQGRQCLKKWGFRRCEDICWIKTNKKNATPGLRHDSNTLFQHSKVVSCTIFSMPHVISLLLVFSLSIHSFFLQEHCLMGIKGTLSDAALMGILSMQILTLT
ncbi:hypothetical protein GUJ93_ZPchr0012g21049 [Zizania palustris]|uniref:Uncharacterized protein n=1 Tax=Zizania palustris TaxID=103762 RepID=A0A8J5WLF2_ZIZPA|nr:hypothetical protein GUJ93_ZPchr0012g21049 [Zizania palustris]KAG8091772.1 hypothetical protein GUJ93_ZPchr0012g21049 [Zizania palustris]